MQSHDLSLGTLLKDFLTVPDYQREYVWTTDIVEQLLQDIFTEFSNGSEGGRQNYFVGTIVTNYVADKNLYELVDGQQRVTTFYVLLTAIRDYLVEANSPMKSIDEKLFGLNVDESGNETPVHRVVLQYQDSQGVLAELVKDRIECPIDALPTSTRSAANIVEAYRTARSFIDRELSNSDSVRKFYAYLVQSVYLIRIETDTVERALWIFETINSRGQGLDAMDLLKNLLFRNAKTTDFDNLKQRWKQLVDTLYTANERPIAFIRYYLLAEHAHKQIRADDVYRWLTDAKNSNRPNYWDDPVRFATQLLDASRAYVGFAQGKLERGAHCEPLANILRFNRTARQHIILALAARRLPPESQYTLAEELERLSFVYLLTRQRANRFEQLFVDWSVQLRHMTTSTELRAFLADAVVPERTRLTQEFEQALRGIQTDTIPKYRLKFVLAKLTQYVDNLAYGDSQLNEYLGKNSEVEHILPTTADKEWIAKFGTSDAATASAKRLANLTLLERSLNAVGSNRPFSEKLDVYAQSRFLITKGLSGGASVGKNTKVNRALELVPQFEDWTPEAMESREDSLVNIALRVWQTSTSEAAR